MIAKLLPYAVMAAAFTGAVYIMSLRDRPGDQEHGGPATSLNLVRIKTKSMTVPVIVRGVVKAYYIVKYSSTILPERSMSAAAEPEALIESAMLHYFFETGVADLSAGARTIELNKASESVKTDVNSKWSRGKVQDVLISELQVVEIENRR